ncbi:MAG: FeoB-associated Cys-rich membrane protein [Spirochaetales bacterium]|nr:FeoB-associated Cys-rich membrane protein [Spirochaetales bacterium]
MGTLIVLLALAAVVSLIVVSMVRGRKAGKSSCGHKCGCCPLAGQCHAHSKQT